MNPSWSHLSQVLHIRHNIVIERKCVVLCRDTLMYGCIVHSLWGGTNNTQPITVICDCHYITFHSQVVIVFSQVEIYWCTEISPIDDILCELVWQVNKLWYCNKFDCCKFYLYFYTCLLVLIIIFIIFR